MQQITTLGMEQHIIDFDAASSAWRFNKRALGNGMFAY
jgi:hypothetical protein